MNAIRFVAPFAVFAFMLRNAVRDDEAFRRKVSQRAHDLEHSRRLDDSTTRRLRLALEVLPLLDRDATLGHADQRSVLPSRDHSLLAIDHRNSVSITGAKEPTTSSCPSREQMTPG